MMDYLLLKYTKTWFNSELHKIKRHLRKLENL